jgi:hypothetical protein
VKGMTQKRTPSSSIIDADEKDDRGDGVSDFILF